MPVVTMEEKNIKVIATLDGETIGEYEIPMRIQELTDQTEPFYKRIRISFINAGTIVIDENDWDDYEIYDGFLVIKKGDSWIAMYNLKEIFSVVLEK